MRKIIMKCVAPAVLIAMFAGCQSAVEPSPEPPAQTFIGTWMTTHPEWRDDDIIGTATVILTFTNSRYIEYTLIEGSDGTFIDSWAGSGTWDDTGGMISRTWGDWDDDNDRWQSEPTSVEKDYVWTEGGKVLFMEPWGDEEKTHSFARFERVNDPLPGGILGSWTCAGTSQRDGATYTYTYTYTFGESSFVADFDRPGKTVDFAGSPQYDAENNFIFVTVQQAAGTLDGSDEHFDPTRFIGHEFRFAWAPTGAPDELVMSPYFREQTYDDETNTWKDHDDNPYGNYILRMGRQATTPCWS